MSCKCNVCWAWSPTKWEVYRWTDTVARCKIKDKFTTSDETCEDANIVKPKNNVTMPRYVRRDAELKAEYKELERKQQNNPMPAVLQQVMTGEMYPHQLEAIEKFKDAAEIALFLEMGTGKTAIALRIAAHKFKTGQIDALLVIAPNDVHVQWAHQEIPLWLDCPYDIQCLYGRGGAKQAYPFEEDPDFLQVVVVNIDTFSTPKKWQDIPEWANNKRTFIVLDEATVIKNVTAARTQRLLYEFNNVVRKNKTIKSSVSKSVARAVLTGTPVTNGPFDMWAMMEFLRPNFFGRNWYSFKFHYGMFTTIKVEDSMGVERPVQVPLSVEWWEAIKRCQTYEEAFNICACSEDTFNTVHAQDAYVGPYKHADELKERIAPVSYFKLLTECREMPERINTTRELTMSPDIERCYNDMVTELITEYEDAVMSAKNKLTALIRLQQICSGFIVDKPPEIEDIDEELGAVPQFIINGEAEDYNPRTGELEKRSDAVERLYGLIDDVDVTEDNGVVWIGKSNPKLDALYRDIDESSKPVIIITRFTAEASRIFDEVSSKYRTCLMTGWKRVGTVQEFQDGKFDVMVANGGVVDRGLNLQKSHTILFYGNTFSLERRLQTEGRIFRIGQQYPCEYIDYSYTDSIDEKITSALVLKRNLLDFVRGVKSIKELV